MTGSNDARLEDRRISRTKARLGDALFILMSRKRWERITVQNILDEADVGRSTFYSHYDTKLDLLLSRIPSIGPTLGDPAEPGGLPDLTPLFAHVVAVREVVSGLFEQSVSGAITDHMHDTFAADWERILRGRNPSVGNPVVYQYLAGATVSCLRFYVTNPECGSPEEVADRFSRLTRGVLSAEL